MTELMLDEINRIADLVHPTLPEPIEVFAERLRLFPEGCLSLGDPPKGYAFFHPWIKGEAPTLGSLLRELPANPDAMHLHDIAVLPEMRGSKVSSKAVAAAERSAKSMGIRTLQLVSVYGTHVLWERFGFHIVEDHGLDSYGSAHLMMREVKARP